MLKEDDNKMSEEDVDAGRVEDDDGDDGITPRTGWGRAVGGGVGGWRGGGLNVDGIENLQHETRCHYLFFVRTIGPNNR
jgi:hypothetical protein